MKYSLFQLNCMDREAFVAALGAVFEEMPEVAAQVWEQRPFSHINELYQKMVDIVNTFDEEKKLTLMRSHPRLGSKAAMADASVREQAGVGLNRLSLDESDRLQELNDLYQEKFGFPFIMAVKGSSRDRIKSELVRRLENAIEQEKEQALLEIAKIARLRLEDLVEEA